MYFVYFTIFYIYREYKPEKGLYKRGPYRAYGIPLKQEAIKMMEEEGKDIKEVSTILKVQTKNIKSG